MDTLDKMEKIPSGDHSSEKDPVHSGSVGFRGMELAPDTGRRLQVGGTGLCRIYG